MTMMLGDTNNKVNIISDPLRVDGTGGIHTISIHMMNFTGRVYIQATLADQPTDTDWFDIWLSQATPFLEYPMNKPLDTTYVPNNFSILPGFSGADACTIRGNFTFMRAKIDRTYLNYQPASWESMSRLGVITKIFHD